MYMLKNQTNRKKNGFFPQWHIISTQLLNTKIFKVEQVWKYDTLKAVENTPTLGRKDATYSWTKHKIRPTQPAILLPHTFSYGRFSFYYISLWLFLLLATLTTEAQL